jgi:DNA polymerase-1
MRLLMDHYKDKAKDGKAVRTLYGRCRHFNGSTKDYAALNARIQGSAADIMKDAMVKIWEGGVCDVIGAPHLTVHDELDLSSPDTKVGREAIAEIKDIMEHTVRLSLPLRVDAQSGPNWGTCE